MKWNKNNNKKKNTKK